jgi:hypothetical protein
MTKKELVKTGKGLGLSLSEKSLKVDLEKAVAKAEKANTGKKSTAKKNGEF